MQTDHRLLQRQRLLADERVRNLIGRRAYELYLERGGGFGKDQEDWARAEEDVVSLLQELIENESQLQITQKSRAKTRTISAVTQRSSKKTPLPAISKKQSGATPRTRHKGIPKNEGKITPPAGSSPQSTM